MFDHYFKSLSSEQRDKLAEKLGTSTHTILNHYACTPKRRKTPQKETFNRFCEVLSGQFSDEQLASYFFIEPAKAQRVRGSSNETN